MRVAPVRKPTLQAALGIGFALVVGLWAYTGYEFTTRMASVEDASAAVTARYFRAQDRLASIRSQVLVASVHVRDALLEPDRALIPRYETQIEEIYSSIDLDAERVRASSRQRRGARPGRPASPGGRELSTDDTRGPRQHAGEDT